MNHSILTNDADLFDIETIGEEIISLLQLFQYQEDQHHL